MKLLRDLNVSGLTATAAISVSEAKTEVSVITKAGFELIDLCPDFRVEEPEDFSGKTYLDI
jgi:hypothetical protein